MRRRDRNPAALRRRQQAAIAGHNNDTNTARHHLNDNNPTVRSTALRALDRVKDLTSAELAAGVSDSHPVVRVAALELAASCHLLPLSSISSRLSDNDTRVVEMAAWACAEIAGRHTDEADATDRDVLAVVTALARVATSHADLLCRESAVAALGAIGNPEGLSAVLSATKDKPAIRLRAVIALAGFDSPEVPAALKRAQNDRARQVRAAAAELAPILAERRQTADRF